MKHNKMNTHELIPHPQNWNITNTVEVTSV